MTALNLHIRDTATRTVRKLEPITPGTVSIYLCGATVQGSPHIGHLRSAIAFDVLIRWLRRCGQNVIYVRNVTDIDDKILNKSRLAQRPWWAHAYIYEREFARAYDTLGILPPTYEPRATGHITDQIELVQRLIDRSHAYSDGRGNVYFDVRSLPEYGELTHQSLDDLATTEDDTQIDSEVESGKRDPRDFALWKAAKGTEPQTASWDSPWGRGRPGWHLECSAMSVRYLGTEFDIHGGGIDLRFPHHENEQAQSRAAGWGFARTWMHNAWVTIKGEKMSKSLGNSLTIEAITKDTPAVVVRFALGTVNYGSTVEYSAESLALAAKNWERIAGFVTRAFATYDGPAGIGATDGEAVRQHLAEVKLPEQFVTALDNDLNVAAAMAAVYGAVKAGATALGAGDEASALDAAWQVRAMLDILGLDPLAPNWAQPGQAGSDRELEATRQALAVFVDQALADRADARAAKDWARADALRDQLAAAGIVVADGREGATWSVNY